MIRPFTLYVICLLAVTVSLPAQKQLLIERSGSPRPVRLQMYDMLTFQLHDDDAGWYTRQILDMDAGTQLILLGNTWFRTTDISRIRMGKQRAWPNIIGGALAGGGATMILGDLWYTLRDRPENTQGGIEFGLANIAAGYAIKSLLGPVKYRTGPKRRLRVIDTTF